MKYYIENGTLYNIDIFRDDNAESPRTFCDTCSHMCIWWNNYLLGDYCETKGVSPTEYLEDLVSERLPDADVEGKNPLEMLETLYADDDFLALPLYIYEHGDLTISTSDIVNPYGHWDSGMAGFIWTDKDTFFRWYGQTDDWRDAAKRTMMSEVEEYDMYLLGEVYCVQTAPYDIDEQDFAENDGEVIGGYFSRKCGDDLYEYITGDITGSDLYDDFDAALAELKKDLVNQGRLFEALQIA